MVIATKNSKVTHLYLELIKIREVFLNGLFASSSKCKFGTINQRFRFNLIAKIV
ncbi:hypothetical protein SAMN04489724_3188 [Algoriphagus locisalis]|uniref:Uncharacterized protein n=1 Tax=Algoriphagus locisalis TaxID=305507 RepID=A0A1I7CH65_9BACT|nr:hypothetical protein SAMN04489724_3188 [Algoriphagus locisalis]